MDGHWGTGCIYPPVVVVRVGFPVWEFDGLGWISGFVVVALPGIVGTGGAGVWVGFALIFVGTDYVGQFESPLQYISC